MDNHTSEAPLKFGFTICKEVKGYIVIYHPRHSQLKLTLPIQNAELHRDVLLRAKAHFEILVTLDERNYPDE